MSARLSSVVESDYSLSTDVCQLIGSVNETFDPSLRFARVVGVPDPWQAEFLNADDEFILALCSRQVGKSTTVGGLAWHELTQGRFVLIVAPSERQARELFRKVLDFQRADPFAPKIIRSTMTELELINGGRLVSAPSTSDTIRGYAAVNLLILEEMAFQADETITAVLPMRADNGRILGISTPAGRSGLFYELWTGGTVRRINALSINLTRLASKVEFDRRHMPAIKFRQEHLCEFLGSGTPFFDPQSIADAIDSNSNALVLQ